ncbi:MAG: hypothetical protein ABJA79_02590 [Parafilimonas sp.]
MIVGNSTLSLAFTDAGFSNNLHINKPVYYDTTEDYELLVGKAC